MNDKELTTVSFLILWKGMKPFGFIPFFIVKNGGNVMKEYKRMLLPLQKEKY